MKISRLLLCGLMIGILSLTGCGGGGGGNAAPAPTTATVKLSTAGTLPPGTSLAGIGITVTLPAGVTVKTDANGVLSGVVTVTGVAAPGTAISSYTPASGGSPATLTLVVTTNPTASNPTAVFGIGEFATVICDLAVGIAPTAADFTLSSFQPIDPSGNIVSGLTPHVAVTLN